MVHEAKIPSWLFRVSANAENGGGHVSRSLILASAMDADISFSVPAHSPYRALIEKQGFKAIAQDEESPFYDGIWIDAYNDNFDFYREKTRCLAIIEDHKDLYDKADLYVRPFPGEFKIRPEKIELNGFEYALVDKKFFSGTPKTISRDVSIITVFMGRYDSVNATGKILETLNTLDDRLNIQVVMGGNAAHLETVKSFLENGFRHQSTLFVDLPDLKDIFSDSDILILSGGVAVLEACALGCPSIVLNIADNQRNLSDNIAKKGAIEYAGHVSDYDEDYFRDLLKKTMPHDARLELSKKASALMGKSGASNVAHALMRFSMTEAA